MFPKPGSLSLRFSWSQGGFSSSKPGVLTQQQRPRQKVEDGLKGDRSAPHTPVPLPWRKTLPRSTQADFPWHLIGQNPRCKGSWDRESGVSASIVGGRWKWLMAGQPLGTAFPTQGSISTSSKHKSNAIGFMKKQNFLPVLSFPTIRSFTQAGRCSMFYTYSTDIQI